MKAILISAITSLIVSLITFIFGLKSGKNQADRSKVQELYRDLYKSFIEIKCGIELNHPRKWEDYPERRIGNHIDFLPKAKEMSLSGASAFLQPTVFSSALELERKLLKYGNDYYRLEEDIAKSIPMHLDLFVEGWSKEKNYSNKNYISLKSINPNSLNSQRLIPFGYFFDEGGRRAIIELLKKSDAGVKFELIRGSRILSTISIFPEGLAVTPEEFVNTLFTEVNQSECLSRKELLIIEIDKSLNELSKRIQDPYTFTETICEAIVDVFR